MARTCFDADWRFALTNPNKLDELRAALEPNFNDSSWRKLDLPHDWSIELPRHADNPSGANGGFFTDGMGWYRKSFSAPEAWRGQRVLLEFEGAYHNAEMWLNGRVLAEHPYGYTSFVVDLSDLLVFDKLNVLAVRLNTSGAPHTRWYSGSGLYRHVWLHVKPALYLEPWGTAVSTPEVSADVADVCLCSEVHNTTDKEGRATIAWAICDPTGKEVARTEKAVSVAAGSQVVAEGSVQVKTPARWSVETPHCYTVKVTLTTGDGRDEESVTFGIRSFSFTASEGFVLNGVPLKLKGGCVHHDCGPLGAQTIDRAEERKVELLKASGYNAVRCAHNPPSPAFLDACDRLGMLVMDEAFDVWQLEKIPFDYHCRFNDWWQRDMLSMLRRDRNHPSIILWSIGNELIERGHPEGARIAGMLADFVRQHEPTRPVTAGICDLWGAGPWSQLDELFSHLDVCGYNYEVVAGVEDHKRLPERIVVGTESFPKEAFTYWQAVEQNAHVVGDFVWTALDYLGEAGIGRTYEEGKRIGHMPGWPWHQANCGDIDLCGWKRPQSFYRDILWGIATKPFIAVHPPLPEGFKLEVSPWGWHDVQASWNWAVDKGTDLQVDVYFNCDEVELRLNGRSLGRRPSSVAQRYIATFAVPYEPGTLQAIAWRGGEVVAEQSIQTAGPAVRLELEVDRTSIRACRNDLAFVTVRALDANGVLVPDAAQQVYFTLQGAGTIAAVSSADPCTTESYRGTLRRLWRGRAMAVVRPDGTAGALTLAAHADGLQGATATITCAFA